MAQLIDLGKLRFYWAGEYNGSTVYEINDVVKYGGNVYVYTNTTSASGNLPTDTDYWALMISGLKFEGEYNDATSYQVGDGVAYGGIVYIAIADTTGNEPPNATYWSQFADGIQYEGSYSGSTSYQMNDVVTYGGKSYIAKQLTSGNVPTNPTYWDVLTEGVRGLGVYNNSTTYLPGDIVSYGGNVYINTTTSTGNIPTNTSYWNLMSSGVKYIGAYNSGTAYKINEIVTYGAKMYVAKGATTGNLPTDGTYWDQLVDGISAEGVYNNGTAYVPGDVVAYGPNLYIAIDETTGNIPTNATYWTKFVDSISSAGAYSSGTTYYIGNVVRYGAYLYICKLQSTGNAPTNATYWDLFVSSLASLGAYNSGTTYKLGDIVRYGANLYICKLETLNHIPTNTTYWDLFTASVQSSGAWSSGTTYYTNDIVTYGPNTYIALRETVADEPDVSTSDWAVFAEGINLRGNWATSTLYYINDIVVRGGSTYIATVKHTSSASFANDLATPKWTKFNGGIRWRGEWQPSTAYLVDDVVYAGVTSYISTADFTSNATAFENDTYWDVLALGADYLPSQLGNAGKFLSTNGTNAVWAASGTLDSLTITNDLEVAGDTVSRGNLTVSSRTVNVVNRIKTNNVATLTTDEAHSFDVGDIVTVSGVDVYPANTFDGSYTITATPTTTTFSYAKSGVNVGSTVTTGTTATVIGDVSVSGTAVFNDDVTVDNANLKVDRTAYVGVNAVSFEASAGLTNAAAVFQITGDPSSYAQIAFRNDTPSSSTDVLLYSNNGDDAHGWVDLGITGRTFDQTTYGITGPNDGYVFMEAPLKLTASVTNKALTSNVATLTTSAAHGFTSGFQVTVSGVNATFNGTYTITSTPTNTTFTYAKSAANVASSAVSPAGTATSATGNGNLVFATGAQGDKNSLVFAAGGFDSGTTQMQIIPNSTVAINIAGDSTSATTGALQVAGGAGIGGKVYTSSDLKIEGVMYGGTGSRTFGTTLTNPMAVFTLQSGTTDSYNQFAVKGQDATSSSDVIVYANNGTDDAGWIDLGVTGNNFSQLNYGITGPNDGYIFYEAPVGTSGAGNLVFATGNKGTQNKIVFAAGGFASGTTQMSITPNQKVAIAINTPSTSATTGALTVAGGVGILGDMNVQGNVNVTGTITFGGGGTTVTTSNLNVTDPFIFVGNGNQADIIDLGVLSEHTVTVATITKAITTKALTSNVATLTTSTAHTYRAGDVVVVSSVDATFNGTYSIIDVPTSTTFTYAKTTSNVASTAVSPNGSAAVSARRVFDGIVRDATDSVVKFFDNAVTKPSTTVNFSEAGLTYSSILVNNIDAAAINATGNLTIATNKLTVNASTGAVAIANTLAVTQASTLTGGFVSNGASNVNSTLGVSGLLSANGGLTVTDLTVTGRFDAQEIREDVITATIGSVSANVMTLSYSDGNIFYLASAPSANFTINLTNAPTDNNKTMAISVIVTQGATGYLPNTFQVAGVQTTGGTNGIRWTTGSAPTPTSSAGKWDIFSFQLVRVSSTWYCLGSSVLNF